MPCGLHGVLVGLELHELRMRSCERDEFLCRPWWFTGAGIGGSGGFRRGNGGSGGNGRTLYDAVSHDISVFDIAVLYDVHRGFDADAVADDRFEVSMWNVFFVFFR